MARLLERTLELLVECVVACLLMVQPTNMYVNTYRYFHKSRTIFHTLSGKLTAPACRDGMSFFERVVPSLTRRNPTRFAADFTHALLSSGFVVSKGTGDDLRSFLTFLVKDCLKDEKVGVMKCGDPVLPRFSLSIAPGEFND